MSLSLSSRINRDGRIYLLGLAVIMIMAGCTTINFAPPIASFQNSVTTASAAIGTAFNNLNQFERQLYLDDVALKPEKNVDIGDGSDQPTPLLGLTFQAPSIKARTDSLRLLGTYAQKLTNLVGNNAPQQFSDVVKTSAGGLTTLDKTFAELSSTTYDPTAAKYISPVSELIGSLVKMYYEHRRDEAIREAVNTGASAVQNILGELENDLVNFVKPQQTADLWADLRQLVDYYNHHRETDRMDLQERKNLLGDINKCALAYEASVEINPSGLIDSMRQAHEALIKYANAPRTPGNMNALLATLQAFEQNAQQVSKQVEQIRQATKG